jgi:protein-disulfide isomerase
MDNEQSKRQQKLAERRQKARQAGKRKQWRTIGLTVLGALIFLGVLIYPSYKPISGLLEPEARDHPRAEFNQMGNPDAPVSIVVYSDFLCSHCSQFYTEAEGQLIKDYVDTGLASYTYRVFITHSASDPEREAEAAYCAGDQGKFWDMHDMLFANYGYGSVNGFSRSVLTGIAKKIGVETGQFNTCMDEEKYKDQIQQDDIDGRAAGITGTPAFIINDQIVKGYQSYEQIQQVIEQELAKQQ